MSASSQSVAPTMIDRLKDYLRTAVDSMPVPGADPSTFEAWGKKFTNALVRFMRSNYLVEYRIMLLD